MMTATLDDLEVKSANNLNMYVQAAVTEKVWTTLSHEFGNNASKTAAIVRSLYGLKTAGAAFRSNPARCMESLRYESCKADPDIWLKPETRPDYRV